VGFSDQSLDWVLDGARSAGLILDPQNSSRIFELKPDYTEYIENSTEQSLYYRLANKIAAADRLPGPSAIHEVSMSARRRWLEDPKKLRDGVKYRPPTLNRVALDLNKLNPADFGLGETADSNAQYTMYQVKRGDTLSAVARDMLGSVHESDRIFKANLNKLDSPDRIYPGQMLRIPKL
jgi:nucleoid-associated protein YgaU